jgi:hypothetical protein
LSEGEREKKEENDIFSSEEGFVVVFAGEGDGGHTDARAGYKERKKTIVSVVVFVDVIFFVAFVVVFVVVFVAEENTEGAERESSVPLCGRRVGRCRRP